jgi:hypothetical protein
MEPDNYRLELKIFMLSLDRFVVLDNRTKQLKIEDRSFNVLFKLDLNENYEFYVYIFKKTVVVVMSNEALKQSFVNTFDFNLTFLSAKNLSPMIFMVSDKSLTVDYSLSQYDARGQFILKVVFTVNQHQNYVRCVVPNKYFVFEVGTSRSTGLRLLEQFSEMSLASLNVLGPGGAPSHSSCSLNEVSLIYLGNKNVIVKRFGAREIEIVSVQSKSSRVILKNSPFNSNFIIDSSLNIYVVTKSIDDQKKYLYCFDAEGEFQFRKHLPVFDETLTKFDMYDEKLFFSKRFKLVEVL